jgi:Rtf2 RING-finger
MGGDGGVVAVKRAYMRGAGTADSTGDYSQSNRGEKVLSDRDNALQRMTTCALTKVPLLEVATTTTTTTTTIVACPYGRLYHKEAAVEALLRRRQQQHQQESSSSHNNDDNNHETQEDELGYHIRGLKDLFPVRFHVPEGASIPTCPVTGQELNGQLPVILLVPGNPNLPNVVSQRAMKEIGTEALQIEYGPFHEQIRLAPSMVELEDIKIALDVKRRHDHDENKKKKKKKEKSSTTKKKKDKKRKDETNHDVVVVPDKNENKEPKKQRLGSGSTTRGVTTSSSGAAQVARGRVHDAIKSNDNLSSLFVKDKKTSHKEQAANLFART